MPNGKKHIAISTIGGGILIGVIDWLEQQSEIKKNKGRRLNYPRLILKVLLGIGGGFITSRLPDRIEPASSPNHRSFFHSWVILLGFIALALAIYQSKLNPLMKIIILSLVVGYALHLIADACTPKGLPVI